MFIIPHFKDGVVVRSTDLERLKIYSQDLAITASNTFGPGILYGMDFILKGSDFVLQPGAARLDSGEIVVVDSSDNLTVPSSSISISLNTNIYTNIYLYKQSTAIVSTRQNLAGIAQVVADKWVCGLSLTDPTVKDSVLLGRFVATSLGIKFLRNPAGATNMHTDTWIGNVYTGPRLHGTNAIAPLSITANSIANYTITNDKIADYTITNNKIADRTLIRRNVHQEHGLVVPGTIMAYAGTDILPFQLLPGYNCSISGWLLCDGTALPAPTPPHNRYAKLFFVIGHIYDPEPIDANHFHLPDLRGVFIRGFDNRTGEESRDPDRNGGQFGKYQEDLIKRHSHKVPNDHMLTPKIVDPTRNEWGGNEWKWWDEHKAYEGIDTDDGSRTGQPDLGSETRPKNIAMHYIIYTGEYYIP